MRKTLVLDFETRSEVDLKVVGAYEYSMHPTTQIICASWKLGDDKAPVESWSPGIKTTDNAKKLDRLVSHLVDVDTLIIAHNAFFEQCIVKNVLPKYL